MMPNIYVLDLDGHPLMPIHSYGRAKRKLRSGKAKVVRTNPFTIQLTYKTATTVCQPVTLGNDPGRTNIGLSAVDDTGRCLYSAMCETRNKEIPKLMEERKEHRRASRRGERLRRKRRAKKHGTLSKKQLERILPGCGEPVKMKDIINTEARFNNRKRKPGWLNPTATQLLRTHLNLIHLVEKILPVTRIVIELNRFAFMAMDNPDIKRWQYQKGPMCGYQDHKEALNDLQNGKCLLCGKKSIDHAHHIIPKSKGGSNTLANLAGLCHGCHDKVHKEQKSADQLASKKAGQNKKYGALSVLNQIMPHLLKELESLYPGNTFVTTGMDTKQYRETYNITKDHNTDAYCIACSSLEKQKVFDAPANSFTIRQFRRHNRQRIHRQTERTYYLGKEKVAKNRHKRTSGIVPSTGEVKKQEFDSLEEWYQKTVKQHGAKEADRMRSRLTVKKSTRTIRSKETMQLLPGAKFRYEGKTYIMSGNHGSYLRAYGEGTREFPKSKCNILEKNRGLVYL